MKNLISRSKQHLGKVTVGGAALLGSTAAMASSSPGAAAIGELQAEVSSLAAAAWPIATAVAAVMIGIKLFKKFANKAT